MQQRCGLALLLSTLVACGGGTANGTGTRETVSVGTPRPGGPVDLVRMVPAGAVTVLHADLGYVRRDPARYARIANELATELGLSAEAATLRALLDQTDAAVGVFRPAAGRQEGLLLFSGRYSTADFDRALAIASARHGAEVAPQATASGGRLYALGDATVAQLDQWTWGVAVGDGMRAHLAQVSLGGGSPFGQHLAEFGPRIGLPEGSAQAWADQNQQVGVDMFSLVLAGENPQMVHNFVATVMRHLGI
ncbi:MAG: hypothetical protein AB7S26_06845 [Sandaracinaceae bacterium]